MSNYDRKRYLLRLFICSFGILVLVGVSAEAKLLNIRLVELIEKSDFIAYGETMDGMSTPAKVLFRPEKTLKGKALPAGEEISLCNQPEEVESYDLRKMRTHYVVFASKKWRCYKPVHGASSIVEVADGIAHTFAIADQPAGQPFDEFIKKIQSHLK